MPLMFYCWLLCLYPGSYRQEFGEEMTSTFREARRELPPAVAVKLSFYLREFSGLLSGALHAHIDRLFDPAASSGRFDVQPHSPFRRSTVFLMLVMFAVVVLALAEAIRIAGGTLAVVWPSLRAVMAFMLLSVCGAAAVVLGILHALRRNGAHRLEKLPVESNGKR